MSIIIDKEKGYSSDDILALVRKNIDEPYITHAGDLESSASGVFIVLVGSKEVKIKKDFEAEDKEYIVIIKFEKNEDDSKNLQNLTIDKLDAVLKQFRGLIKQGTKQIDIKDLQLFQCILPNMIELKIITNCDLSLELLAEDIIRALGASKRSVDIIRIRSGYFELSDALPIQDALAEYKKYKDLDA